MSVTLHQLLKTLVEQGGTCERLGEILCRRGDITQPQLLDILARQLGCAVYDPTRDAVTTKAFDLVPVEFSRRHRVLPVRLSDETLAVAMADPLDVQALDHLRGFAARAGRELEVLVAPAEVLAEHRETNYARVEGNRNVNELIDRVVDEMGEGDQPVDDDAQLHANDAGVVNLVNQIISRAVTERL